MLTDRISNFALSIFVVEVHLRVTLAVPVFPSAAVCSAKVKLVVPKVTVMFEPDKFFASIVTSTAKSD